ncbi:hypothetical protein [Amycolatopsis minnesotensis]|uniref:Uncharacterized protein n=1 Tax=Amycolatopsis minnesotensis TaxID=337894 RepID=A0ABP5E9Z4_9PSEU
MAKKKVSLRNGASAAEVLDVARAALERKDYLWVPQDSTKAEAHQGGKEVKRKAFTYKLRLGLEVHGRELVMHNISNGVGMSGPGVTWVRLRMAGATKAVKHALQDAKLT